jgi:thiol-disulfide isomerase/thioredoxin
VTFRPDSTTAARFARFWSDLRGNMDTYYARLQAMVDDGADEKEIARFQDEYDWSANRLVLEGALRENPDPRHRGTLLTTYLTWAGGIDSRSRILYEWLLAEYPRSYEARRARARFGLRVGATAPAFAVRALSDSSMTYTNDTFAGQVVLIDFWAVWCAPCVAEMPVLHAAYEKYGPAGFTILSASFDDAPEDVARFRSKTAWSMPWVHAFVGDDWTSDIVTAFQIPGLPRTVLVDRDGVIVAVDSDLRGARLDQTLSGVMSKR